MISRVFFFILFYDNDDCDASGSVHNYCGQWVCVFLCWDVCVVVLCRQRERNDQVPTADWAVSSQVNTFLCSLAHNTHCHMASMVKTSSFKFNKTVEMHFMICDEYERANVFVWRVNWWLLCHMLVCVVWMVIGEWQKKEVKDLPPQTSTLDDDDDDDHN